MLLTAAAGDMDWLVAAAGRGLIRRWSALYAIADVEDDCCRICACATAAAAVQRCWDADCTASPVKAFTAFLDAIAVRTEDELHAQNMSQVIFFSRACGTDH